MSTANDADNPSPSRLLRVAAPALVAVVILGLWQALVTFYDVPVYLVPSPAVVALCPMTQKSRLTSSRENGMY